MQSKAGNINAINADTTSLWLIKTQKEVLIDARSEGRFKGTEKEPREGLRSGNIPNSLNLPFTEVLNKGKYKSLNEIKSIFKAYELPKRPYIFSCGSGVTACILMLAAELVYNNQMAVYDGSWTEWASLENLK